VVDLLVMPFMALEDRGSTVDPYPRPWVVVRGNDLGEVIITDS
jgi:hypothetical protein